MSLHQRAQLVDGTKIEIRGLEMSDRKSGRPRGPQQVPGNEVTAWLEIQSPGRSLEAAEVQVAVSYADHRGLEVQLVPLVSNEVVVPPERSGQVGKKFRVEDLSGVFQAQYLRVVVELPGYSPVTFAGSVP